VQLVYALLVHPVEQSRLVQHRLKFSDLSTVQREDFGCCRFKISKCTLKVMGLRWRWGCNL